MVALLKMKPTRSNKFLFFRVWDSEAFSSPKKVLHLRLATLKVFDGGLAFSLASGASLVVVSLTNQKAKEAAANCDVLMTGRPSLLKSR